MSNPLVSIVIPTFNRGHVIGETLDSILAQTFSNWECIVVDDGSSDMTAALVKTYSEKDSRFSFYTKLKNLPKGPSASRNLGMRLAKGKFINFFDSDDLMLPDKLETDLEIMQQGNYDFIISQNSYFSRDKEVEDSYWNEKLYSNNPINDFIVKNIGWSVNAPLWRKESLQNKNIVFDEYLLSGDDFLFHLEALQKELVPGINDKITAKIRRHENQLSGAPVKAHYKLYIIFLLLSQNRFSLSAGSKKYLQKEGKKQIKNAFGAKKYGMGFKYLLKFTLLEKHPRYIYQLIVTVINKKNKLR